MTELRDPASTDAAATVAPGPEADAAAYIDELAARAEGTAPTFLGAEPPPPPPPTIAEARRHLDEAWEHATAGIEVPDAARMRQVKKAVLLAMRPVTSHQVQFNQQLAIAVKELAIAVDSVVPRVDAAAGGLGEATTRVHAALATVEVTVDDVLVANARLTALVEELAERTERLEEEVLADRAEMRALRARQDIVLRNAAGAVHPKAEKRRLAALADELDGSAELLAEDLAEVTRGSRDDVRAELVGLVDDVGGAGGPVLDLGSGRGEWLELLHERGIPATGVDSSGRAVAGATRRGLAVREADPVTHLAGQAESSLGAVTAFGLVERLSTHAQLELFDRALLALRPGGLLVVSAANPTALDVGAAEVWLDPARRRPVHPQLLELLALARGFGEAEVRWLHPVDEGLRIHPDDLSGLAPARAAALADRLNQVVAGPRAYAVLARKPGGAALPTQ